MRGLSVGAPVAQLWSGLIAPDAVVDAELTPISEVPNWFASQISRVEPIEGVLAYDQERMIDVRAEIAVAQEAEAAAKAQAEAEAGGESEGEGAGEGIKDPAGT